MAYIGWAGYQPYKTPYTGYGTQKAKPDIGQEMLAEFGKTWKGLMTPDEMFKSESAPIRQSFAEAGERARSRQAALGAGNVRAIQEGEKTLAREESSALGKLRSQIGERSIARQLMGANLLKLLKELAGAGGPLGAIEGGSVFGR